MHHIPLQPFGLWTKPPCRIELFGVRAERFFTSMDDPGMDAQGCLYRC